MAIVSKRIKISLEDTLVEALEAGANIAGAFNESGRYFRNLIGQYADIAAQDRKYLKTPEGIKALEEVSKAKMEAWLKEIKEDIAN